MGSIMGKSLKNLGMNFSSRITDSIRKMLEIPMDLLSAADEIQKMAETTLGGKFETVVALDDFAYKSHFK
ncbi:hypothetical protein NECAME_17719, partial [Necator americanus]